MNKDIAKKYYDRELLDELKKWVSRREILAVRGPRQAGKTTLMEMFIDWLVRDRGVSRENIHMFTFEDLEILERFVTDPKEFVESFMRGSGKHYFFFDEFHYAKDGGRKLKLLYDTLDNVKFMVTGSSSLEITEFSKYLVGRVFLFDMFPFSFREFLNVSDKRMLDVYDKKNRAVRDFVMEGKDFSPGKDIFIRDVLKLFEEYVIFGGYPAVVMASERDTKITILKNLYETYITKDIVGLLKISDAFKFKKLVSILSSQIAGIINYNELATSTGSYYKEVKDSLNALEETYVIKLLRPFHKNLKTELRKNPKIVFLDSGLRNYSVSDFNPLENRSDRGMLIESVAYSLLVNATRNSGRINYWRTLSKAEVDFIITIGSEIIPVEVKFAKIKKPKVSRSFRSFITSYMPDRALILTMDFWGEKTIGKTRIKFVPVSYL